MLIILHFITHWLDLVVIILEMNKDFLKDPENLNYLLIYLQYLCLIKKSKKPHILRCKTLFPANRSFSNLPNIADYLHVSPYLEKLRVNSKKKLCDVTLLTYAVIDIPAKTKNSNIYSEVPRYLLFYSVLKRRLCSITLNIEDCPNFHSKIYVKSSNHQMYVTALAHPFSIRLTV